MPKGNPSSRTTRSGHSTLRVSGRSGSEEPSGSMNSMRQNLRILVFGTFDGLHEGHVNLFRQAKNFGDFLIVVVARDSTVQKNKNKTSQYDEQERLKAVQGCGLVDEAMLGEENHDTKTSQYNLIEKIKPDIICLGYDQAQFEERLKKELIRMNLGHIQIKILQPYKPETYKSSLLNK